MCTESRHRESRIPLKFRMPQAESRCINSQRCNGDRMKFTPLSQVRDRVQVGAPLPFGIHDHDHTLLLAQGQQVQSQAQLQALFARGALVDLAMLTSPAERIAQARPEALPGLWAACLDEVHQTLRNGHHEGFRDALESSSAPVLALVARDPDLAIFQVLRQQGNQHVDYGVHHATHAGITGVLVAQRLGWSPDDCQRVFKAALTMNISMLELQGQLALQTTPPTAEQRQSILAHPAFSRQMLELAGVTDTDWLNAVEQHHEAPDGSGYPHGLREPGELAMLLRRVDIYTAKLSPRATRSAIAADKAGRAMFMQEPGHPMVAALVKEFGVYPPGCFVRLASGETAMVIRRGSTVMAPIVAVVGSSRGAALARPERRDTAQAAYAVQCVLPAHADMARLAPEQLLAVLAG
jgi:HD-GYP domain-containing protein (c-di-GMP phosphodiesterase class II)